MAATNFTPIILYHTTTASAAPTAGNLNNGELAININDGKLFYKDSGGTVQVIATKGTGTIGGSNTQVQYNSSGALAGSANFTFNGTTATINTLNLTNALGTAYGGTALTTYTQGDLVYASAANTLAKLGIGANTYILTSTGSVPQWSAPSAITVSTATNLAGGAAGSVPYQSGASTTTFLSIGSAGQVLTSSGSAPQWSNLSSLGVTSLSFGTTGLTPSTATQGAITVAGTLATTNGGTGLTSFTANGVFYASSTSAVGQSANLTFDGTTLVASNLTDSSLTTGRVVYTTTGGNLTDSANLLYSGTDLTVYGITVGRGAGAVSTNTAVGASALAANTTGVRNTVIGAAAGVTMSTADSVTAVGYGALNANTGSGNTGVGEYALQTNSSGASNTSLGFRALYSNTTASNNTAVGYQAAYTNQTGGAHTALGYQSMFKMTQGTYGSVAIGYQAGYATEGVGDIHAFGTQCFYQNTTGQFNTGVGNLAGGSNLTGGYNTLVGWQANRYNTASSYNTAIGFEVGLNSTTPYNTYVGMHAGYVNGGTSSGTGSNVMIGWKSGYKNTSGSGNTFVGTSSGYENTTGIQNTYVGPNTGSAAAGYYMTTGSKNTILGAYNGNQNSLDIRTANNYIVLSDGDGNPQFVHRKDFGVAINDRPQISSSYVDTQNKSVINLYEGTNGNTEIVSGYATADFVVGTGGTSGNVAYSGNGGSYLSIASGIMAIVGTTFTIGSNTYTVTSESSEGYVYCTPDASGEAASGTLVGLKYATEGFRVYDNRTAQFKSTVGVGGTAGSTSGAGITFPATQSASSNANTLDDYEEGTWTPTIEGTTTDPSGISYTQQYGRYTKVGNVVYLSFRVAFTFTNGTGSGAVAIRGIPFTPSNNPQPKATPQQDNITYTGFTYLDIAATQNNTWLGLGKNRSGLSASSVVIGDCSSSGTDINGGVYYFV